MNFINNVNDEYSKYLLVLERLDQSLTTVPSDDDDDIVLEGTAAIFGITNENNRVYEKAEYLPHLEYLKEKIKQKRLFGELDHPQRFDIAFANVSHVIESLDYDPSSNSVKIRVRLLDTPSGKIAKTLMDEGVQLAVSTRGCGSLGPDNVVGDNFFLIGFDLVVSPSVSTAFVENIMENQQYIVGDNGLIAVNMENFRNDLAKNGTRNLYNDLNKFLNSLKSKL